jgi:hypothetical protein
MSLEVVLALLAVVFGLGKLVGFVGRHGHTAVSLFRLFK